MNFILGYHLVKTKKQEVFQKKEVFDSAIAFSLDEE